MVAILESIANLRTVYKKPWLMIIYGAIYAVFSVLLALYVFPKQASIVMIFFTVMLSTIVAHKVIKHEKNKNLKKSESKKLFKAHKKSLLFFLFLFLGYLLAFSILIFFMSKNQISASFGTQVEIIKTPYEAVRGSAYPFLFVFNEKFKILLFCIIFSFAYGAGTIFILVWNAALVGTAIGSIMRKTASAIAVKAGSPNVAAYFSGVSVSLAKFLSFGIFEIAGYFTAAIASGMIAIAVIRQDFKKPEFKTLVFNVINLLLVSIALLLISSVIEVYVARPYFK